MQTRRLGKIEATRKAIKKTIECEHKKYIADILNIGDDITEEQQARTSITKKFWQFFCGLFCVMRDISMSLNDSQQLSIPFSLYYSLAVYL
jgi:hypothetical protein